MIDPYRITVTKLQVAERNLDTATWLWFNEGDAISIASLTAAALGVLDDLWHHDRKKRPPPFTDAFVPAGMTPKQARKLFKADGVFAKHARTDPEGTRDYSPERVTTHLFLTCAAYFNLASDSGRSGLQNLFCFRVGIEHPEFYDPPRSAVQTPDEQREVERLKGLSRIEFFKERAPAFIGSPPRQM